MLMIKFQRVGRKNDPAFRVVVTEKRSKPKSGELEILGSYHPKTKATALKKERILYWLSKGAKASDTAHNLLVSKGIVQGKKINIAKGKLELSSVAESNAKKPVAASPKVEEEKPAVPQEQVVEAAV